MKKDGSTKNFNPPLQIIVTPLALPRVSSIPIRRPLTHPLCLYVRQLMLQYITSLNPFSIFSAAKYIFRVQSLIFIISACTINKVYGHR